MLTFVPQLCPPPMPELHTSDSSIGIALTSSLCVDVAHLMQLTLFSGYAYDWSRFFRHPDAWPRFLVPFQKSRFFAFVSPSLSGS